MRRKKPQAFVDIDNHLAEVKKFITAKFKIVDANIDNINKKMSLEAIKEADISNKISTFAYNIGKFKSEIEHLMKENVKINTRFAKECKELD